MYYTCVSVWGARPSAFIHVSLVNPLLNFEMERRTGCIQSYTCAQETKYIYTYMQANSSYFSKGGSGPTERVAWLCCVICELAVPDVGKRDSPSFTYLPPASQTRDCCLWLLGEVLSG